MRFVRTILLLGVGLGAVGCMNLGRSRTASTGGAAAKSGSGNTSATSTTAPANNVKPFWEEGANNRAAPPLNVPNRGDGVRPAGNSTDYNGVLAGSLVDSFNRRLPRGYLQVAPADGNFSGRPLEMTVENGYFVVPGLTPGRPYMLTARTVDGERKLAGRAQVTPPNQQVVIKVSEDLYSGTVPPPPGGDLGIGTSGPRAGADGWKPENAPGRGAAEPPAPPLDAPPGEDRPFSIENITGGGNKPRDKDGRRTDPPLINLPGGPSPPPFPEPDAPPTGGRPGTARVPSGRAPMCEFAGPNRLRNFALSDPYGSSWEFSQAQGRLVLLDFWGTWCRPCVAAIPHLKRLHTDYGPQGLEVVSIACERGAAANRSRQVQDAIERYKINYRVLLGEEYDDCPVQQKFRIQSYPTMILLDRSGTVLWRGDANGLNQLEGILKRELRTR